MILDGRVRPGEYLRLERLAMEFGISVTPVREALQSLRSQGFVHLEPRRGFVVAPLSRQDVEDLFWVQAAIGGELTSRAARRMSPDRLAALAGVQADLEKAAAAGRADLAEERNHAFHRAINLSAGSAKLAWSLASVARYVPRGLYGRVPDWPAAAAHDHRRILDALRAGDAETAGGEMRRHIVSSGGLLIAYLERRGMWHPDDQPGDRPGGPGDRPGG
jgi:DNA-binding GntR family transcriptional regulator